VGRRKGIRSDKRLKWNSREIQTLIRGVFRYGENEWQELLLDGEGDEQAYHAGTFCFHPDRTPNEVALKWRQVKCLMKRDIRRVRRQTGGGKVVTKHEWMMGALDMLEKHDKATDDQILMMDEETPQMLYEALFIDPSKLTPYQHA
jgi:hypothetical protein